MKKLIILSIAIITILSCCKKDDLQPEDYKFYCKVGDVEWKRTSEGGFCPGCKPLESDYYPNGSLLSYPGKLRIEAHRDIESKDIRQYIYIVVSGLEEGNNLDSLRIRDIYTDYNKLCGSIEGHSLDTNFTNSFFISKIDTIKRVIQGTFDLRVVNYECNPFDTIRMTEGHFNLSPTWHR